MKKLNIKISALTLLLLGAAGLQAQGFKIGDNPGATNPNSALEVESSTKGVAFPNVALTATNSNSPLSIGGNPATGTVVYNTATAGTAPNNVTPGFYYWDGSAWQRVINGPVGTAGTYTKVTTDAYGRVTSGTTLSASDIPNLDWSKITSGKPTTLSGYGITDGVSTGGSYSNPSWLSSLAWSKISSTPTTISGYGITDAVANSRSIATTAPLSGGGDLSANRTLSISQANTSTDGYLSSTDWNTFNGKVGATRTISTTGPLSGGGDLSANRTLSISQATTSTDGYLSSTDWNTFNGKVGATRSLTINGTTLDLSANRSWSVGTVTSVSGSGGTTGLTLTGGAITTSGTLTLGGTLAIANGGTGATTKAAAFDALSPMTSSGDIIYGGTSGTGTRLAAGTNGDVLTLAGGVPTWATPSAGSSTGTLLNVRYLTSGTSYTPTSGTTKVLIKMVGGGGGGGGALGTSNNRGGLGGGGGAGGYMEAYITLSGSSPYTYVIGGGGAGGSGNNPGSDGTNTSITIGATTYRATFGSGGAVNSNISGDASALGGAGGTGSNGTINITGQAGEFALLNSSVLYGGGGGSSLLGSGGGKSLYVGTNNNSTNGNNATNFGSGGGGAVCWRSSNNQTADGGNGSPGIIIIYEYK